MFSHLRRVFQRVIDFPIFSLFLSTRGSFILFYPETLQDPSIRIRNSDLTLLNPITEISFDSLVDLSEDLSLWIQSWKWTGCVILVVRCKYALNVAFASSSPFTFTGFGALYDALEQDQETHLLKFAKQKSLRGESTLEHDPGPGILACLAVRFGPEFNPTRSRKILHAIKSSII